jgi:hypothetical protein
MKTFMGILLAFFSLTAHALPSLEELEQMLSGAGLQGWIHAAVPEKNLYVFTYRDPENFFEHLEFPLTTSEVEVDKILETLGRHDEVIVKGAFKVNAAPIKHIDAKEIIIVKKFEGHGAEKYKYESKVPEELEGKTELLGKVHAIADEGRILVIEYKDTVIPVYVSDASLTSKLYRNDKIKMKYKIRKSPGRPTHLSLDKDANPPIVVTDPIVAIHGKQGSVEGHLILFPKSPQVLFNVFAVQKVDPDGVKREFTLVNFDDPKVFESIRHKLQNIWDRGTASKIANGRNKLIHLGVKLKATGTFNVVDQGQANPQILLEGPENIVQVE